MNGTRAVRRVSFLVAFVFLEAVPVLAQGTCQRTRTGSCLVGGDVTHTITVTITRATRLGASSSSVPLGTPSSSDFDAGYGQTGGPTLTIKANAAWNVTLRGTQAIWTASPSPARANKPVGDLQWALAAGGPFVNMTTTAATLTSGAAASAGTTVSLSFRVKYAWLLDTPGSYSLPLQLTITAP